VLEYPLAKVSPLLKAKVSPGKNVELPFVMSDCNFINVFQGVAGF
jgi:hypothetical protein